MNIRGVATGRARALRNALVGRGRSRLALTPRGPLVSAALIAVAGGIAWSGLSALFAALVRAGATPAELRAALALALDVALVGLLLFDLESVVSTLILDRDLDLLRRAPLPPGSILAIKLVDSLPRTAMPLAVVALPALAAYAGVQPVPVAAWLAAPFVMALLWAIPLGAGTALTLALLARVPARRAREALGLLSSLALATLWIVNLIVLPRLAAEEGEPLARARALLAAWHPALERTPGGWAAAILGGAPAPGALALVATAGVSVALAGLAAGRHLARVMAAARTPVARTRRKTRRPPAAARRAPLALAVIGRDFKLFLRDWPVLGDVLTTSVLWTLLPLVAVPLGTFESPTVVRAMLLTLSVGLGYEIGARSLPFERRGAAWMRLSPVSARRWAAAKLASAATLGLQLVAVAGVSLAWSSRLGAGEWASVALVVLPALGLSVALGLWTGAAFGDPNWTNPRAVLTLGGRIISAVLVVIQVTVWLVLTVLGGEVSPARHSWSSSLLPGLIAIVLGGLALELLAHRIARPGYYR